MKTKREERHNETHFPLNFHNGSPSPSGEVLAGPDNLWAWCTEMTSVIIMCLISVFLWLFFFQAISVNYQLHARHCGCLWRAHSLGSIVSITVSILCVPNPSDSHNTLSPPFLFLFFFLNKISEKFLCVIIFSLLIFQNCLWTVLCHSPINLTETFLSSLDWHI